MPVTLHASDDAADLAAIQEEAASWFARLRGEQLNDRERAAFARWRQADPRHQREYAILEELWTLSAGLGPRARPRPRRRRLLGAAAGVAGMLLCAAWLGWATLAGRIETAPGERQHLRLADGSELDLGPDTRLRVRQDGRQRQLELERGEILVAVAADPARPFEVLAGGGVVRDIGTRFAVRTDAGGTRVTVAEGRVEVELPALGLRSPVIGAGQQLEFDARGLSPAHPVDATAALAWSRGQLLFDAAPLAQVVQELNRYRRQPIGPLDPALAHIRISGVFLLDDEAGMLRALEQVAPVRFVFREGRLEGQLAGR